MLKQLTKLDFLWANRFYLPLAGANLISALLLRLSTNWESPFGSFMRHFLSSLTISLFFTLFFNILARTIVNFKQRLLKDESYLFRTLPVKTSELWNAKILSSVLSLLIIAFAFLLCLAVGTLTSEIWETLKTLVSAQPLEVLLAALLAFVEFVFLNLCIFDGILLGAKNSPKVFWSIFFSVLLYLGAQLLLLGLLFLLGQFFLAFSSLFTTAESLPVNFSTVLFFVLGYYLVLLVGYYLFGRRTLEKGVDVE